MIFLVEASMSVNFLKTSFQLLGIHGSLYRDHETPNDFFKNGIFKVFPNTHYILAPIFIHSKMLVLVAKCPNSGAQIG